MKNIFDQAVGHLVKQASTEGTNSKIYQDAVKQAAEQQIKERIQLVTATINNLNNKQMELDNLVSKPDDVTCNADGEQIIKGYSKEKAHKIKKIKEFLEKRTALLKTAVESGDFTELRKAHHTSGGSWCTSTYHYPVIQSELTSQWCVLTKAT